MLHAFHASIFGLFDLITTIVKYHSTFYDGAKALSSAFRPLSMRLVCNTKYQSLCFYISVLVFLFQFVLHLFETIILKWIFYKELSYSGWAVRFCRLKFAFVVQLIKCTVMQTSQRQLTVISDRY